MLRVAFLFLSLNLFSQSLTEIREEFPYIEGEDKIDIYIEILEQDDSSLGKGYLSIMYFLLSKELVNPYSKIKWFNRGKKLLDECVNESNDVLELRYLRFGIQTQIPAFLGYKENLESDFNYIINHIYTDNLSLDFKKKIINNLIEIDNLDSSQKTKLKEINL